MKTTTPPLVASYSIERRLSRGIALQIFAVLMLTSWLVYCAALMLIEVKQRDDLDKKVATIETIVREAVADGGEAQLVRTAELMAQRRPGTRLEVRSASGEILYRDPEKAPFILSKHTATRDFSIDLSQYRIGALRMTLEIDCEQDENLLDDLFWALLAMPFLGALIGGFGSAWYIRRELSPLRVLAKQTKAISPLQLDARLSMPVLSEELAPWVNQFNSLMDGLQKAIVQLEAFNADVAHELRTPLAALIGNTEVALSRDRPVAELRETMVTSLEQVRDLSSMVNDMLFLSGADRGALARRGEPTRICHIAKQVVEFHEFALEEAGVSASVEGTAVAAVDAPLLQRALSNLIGNATRYAERGSEVRVSIEEEQNAQIRVVVENKGETISPSVLPRLFDRFFRADPARQSCETHHGLGLAIVSAIARMHGGQPFASSANGITRIGLTLHT